MNKHAIYILLLLLGLSLSGCATSPPIGMEVEKDIALPLTVDKVWYRTDKVRLLGMAYEESGAITISGSAVEFVHEKGRISIPRENIRKVSWGKLSPDITNDWVIVYYSGASKDEVAAFKGALFAGGGRDSKIYSAILHIMKAK